MLASFRAALAVTVAVHLLPAQDLLGVSYTGSIHAIDSLTGASTVVAPGLFGHNCLARDDNGDLWTISRNLLGGPQYFLTRIDPATLAVELVAPNRDVRALANAGSGELFSVEYVANNYQFYRVDTTTGVRTWVGATGAEPEGMVMRQGTLYAWSNSTGLGTIDPTTGAYTAIGGPTTDLFWLAVRADGALVGGGVDLVEIDPATGSFTVLASGIAELRGAASSGMALPFGSGCGGVELTAQGSLRAGTWLTTRSTGYPTTGAVVGIGGAIVVGHSDTTFGGLNLPLNLDPLLGTTGCTLYTSIDAAALGFTTGGATPNLFFPVYIPLGVAHHTFYLQHAAFDPNGAWYWSNALRLRVGS